MKQRVLVVLGAPNSLSGELSPIATQRLAVCMDTYREGDLILCTGGWGPHFNQSDQPHAHYARNHLLTQGIPAKAFLELALSSHTVDDAVKTKASLAPYSDCELIIITSDFHRERVLLIFQEILKGFNFTVVTAKTSLPDAQLQQLKAHEQKAIEGILKKGLYY